MFGRVETKKKDALRRATLWDDLDKERELGLKEIEDRAKAKEGFKSWAVMKEIS